MTQWQNSRGGQSTLSRWHLPGGTWWVTQMTSTGGEEKWFQGCRSFIKWIAGVWEESSKGDTEGAMTGEEADQNSVVSLITNEECVEERSDHFWVSAGGHSCRLQGSVTGVNEGTWGEEGAQEMMGGAGCSSECSEVSLPSLNPLLLCLRGQCFYIMKSIDSISYVLWPTLNSIVYVLLAVLSFFLLQYRALFS